MAGPSSSNPWFSSKDASSRSFKEVLAGSSSSLKLDFVHSTFKGTPALILDDSVVSKLAAPFTITLVGKFMLRRPNLDIIRKLFVNLKLSGSFSFGLLDPRHIAIQLNNDLDYSRIFARRTYYIMGCQMRLLKWTPDFDVREESPIVPVWVCFPNLRLHFFNNQVLFALASFFGRPLQTDQATSNLSRPSVARVLVELDVSKKFPKKIWIGSELNGKSKARATSEAAGTLHSQEPIIDRLNLEREEGGAHTQIAPSTEGKPLEGNFSMLPEDNIQEIRDEQLLDTMSQDGTKEKEMADANTDKNSSNPPMLPNSSPLNVQVIPEDEIRDEGEFVTSPMQMANEDVLGTKGKATSDNWDAPLHPNNQIVGMNRLWLKLKRLKFKIQWWNRIKKKSFENKRQLLNTFWMVIKILSTFTLWSRIIEPQEASIKSVMRMGILLRDNWFDKHSVDQAFYSTSNSKIKVSYFISDSNWDGPKLRDFIPDNIAQDIMNIPFNLDMEDKLVCDLVYKGCGVPYYLVFGLGVAAGLFWFCFNLVFGDYFHLLLLLFVHFFPLAVPSFSNVGLDYFPGGFLAVEIGLCFCSLWLWLMFCCWWFCSKMGELFFCCGFFFGSLCGPAWGFSPKVSLAVLRRFCSGSLLWVSLLFFPWSQVLVATSAGRGCAFEIFAAFAFFFFGCSSLCTIECS
ncbi:hypothetical protein M5K25_004918 [Dendrobium thyrsiflorum]|uniref:DUF4283 domain-containing protein n=1 Tax=Dendrobium thyrsiflorum TaxID=117978 RepID=A0ABD0VHA1_DENTH